MVDPFFRPVAATGAGSTSIDAGLREHMQRVYNYMAGGLVATGLVSFTIAHTQLAEIIFGSPLKWIAILGPLAFMFFLPGMSRYSIGQMKVLFWSFCAVMGLSMTTIFFAYSEA